MREVDEAIQRAAALMQAGQAEAAIAPLRRAVQKAPMYAPGQHALAAVLLRAGKPAEALAHAQRAAMMDPRQAAYRAAIGDVRAAMGDIDQAATELLAAWRLNPADAGAGAALERLVALLRKAQRFEQLAETAAELARAPGAGPGVLIFAADWLTHVGRHDEALAVLRSARERFAGSPELRRALLIWCYADGAGAAEVFQMHESAGAAVSRTIARDARPFVNVRDPEKPLRVGYISQDFRDRSAAHFIEPIVSHHDRTRVEAVLFSVTAQEDAMTARLRASAAGWVDARALSERDLAARVRAEGVDILVDLTGHTGFNRVLTLCHRAAPVQATYLGYPNTTGLAEVDYRIVDAVSDPVEHAGLATERLERIEPCFLCYAPPEYAPEVVPPPCAQRDDGVVTFGSFNTHGKITATTLRLWGGAVRAASERGVPTRLLVKNDMLADARVRERFMRELGAVGIAAERVELLAHAPTPREHLAMYGEVDIALDTTPYSGTTTTMEALWMGAPVVTLLGDRHSARVSASLLSAVGAGEWAARTSEDYARIAAELASDRGRLGEIRGELRRRVAASAVCGAPAFVRRLEDLYRRWWRDWCAGAAGTMTP